MTWIVLLNKPWGVLTQFRDAEGRPTLADYMRDPGFYPAGRLDRDSEGLVLLTDDGPLQARISHPRHKLAKTYIVQVEGVPDGEALDVLRTGVTLRDGTTAPAKVVVISEPDWIWPRDPPVRSRKTVPDRWLRLTLSEGRNRQVRRMTSAVGHPTLRLIRWSIGDWTLEDLAPGETRHIKLDASDVAKLGLATPLEPLGKRPNKTVQRRGRAPVSGGRRRT